MAGSYYFTKTYGKTHSARVEPYFSLRKTLYFMAEAINYKKTYGWTV